MLRNEVTTRYEKGQQFDALFPHPAHLDNIVCVQAERRLPGLRTV
jgi:hypothetical protein